MPKARSQRRNGRKFCANVVVTRTALASLRRGSLKKVLASLNVPRRSCSLPLLSLAFSSMAALAAPTARGADPISTETRSGATARDEGPRLSVPILHAAGLLTVMRASEAYLWPQPFAETDRFKIAIHYQEAFSRPPLWDGSRPLFEEDGDRWQINVLGHGLFGSELYLRARVCRLVPWQALLFTAGSSATWEYGFEASGVRPSALDLTFTPLAGLVLGEARFQTWRAVRKLGSGPLRTTLSAVVDPLGELERAFGSPC